MWHGIRTKNGNHSPGKMHARRNESCIQQCVKFIPNVFHQSSFRQSMVIGWKPNNLIFLRKSLNIAYLIEKIPKTCDIKGQRVLESFKKYHNRLEWNQSTIQRGVDSYKTETRILKICLAHEIPSRRLCSKDSSTH